MGQFMRIKNMEVYRKWYVLHIEVCDLSHDWPSEEWYELGAKVHCSPNSSASNFADKHSDRHLRKQIEGVTRSRGKGNETIHHLYVARLKRYLTAEGFEPFRDRYGKCVRILNGLERTLESRLPQSERRWKAPA